MASENAQLKGKFNQIRLKTKIELKTGRKKTILENENLQNIEENLIMFKDKIRLE